MWMFRHLSRLCCPVMLSFRASFAREHQSVLDKHSAAFHWLCYLCVFAGALMLAFFASLLAAFKV